MVILRRRLANVVKEKVYNIESTSEDNVSVVSIWCSMAKSTSIESILGKPRSLTTMCICNELLKSPEPTIFWFPSLSGGANEPFV